MMDKKPRRKGAGRPEKIERTIKADTSNWGNEIKRQMDFLRGASLLSDTKLLWQYTNDLMQAEQNMFEAATTTTESTIITPPKRFQHVLAPLKVDVSTTPFSTLSAEQLKAVLPLLNKHCFVEALSVAELQEVFEGKRTAKVKNIGVLAYILKKLAMRGLICADWQHQAESLKMFVSVRNTPIKGNKMASYLSTFEEQIKAYNGWIYKDNIPPTYKAKKELKQEIDDIVNSL